MFSIVDSIFLFNVKNFLFVSLLPINNKNIKVDCEILILFMFRKHLSECLARFSNYSIFHLPLATELNYGGL